MSDPVQPFITWLDIFKLLSGFAASLVLIWAKSEGERIFRIRTLKRSAWNVAKHHTDYRELLVDLDEVSSCAEEGMAWISSVNLSSQYSAIVAELSSLDAKNSEIYVSYLSAEEVVRCGYEQLSKLRLEFIKARAHAPALPEECISLRGAMRAQCSAIRKDLCYLAQQELELLALVRITRTDAIDPIPQLKQTIDELKSSNSKDNK